jgi:hypothetical protein
MQQGSHHSAKTSRGSRKIRDTIGDLTTDLVFSLGNAVQ